MGLCGRRGLGDTHLGWVAQRVLDLNPPAPATARRRLSRLPVSAAVATTSPPLLRRRSRLLARSSRSLVIGNDERGIFARGQLCELDLRKDGAEHEEEFSHFLSGGCRQGTAGERVARLTRLSNPAAAARRRRCGPVPRELVGGALEEWHVGRCQPARHHRTAMMMK